MLKQSASYVLRTEAYASPLCSLRPCGDKERLGAPWVGLVRSLVCLNILLNTYSLALDHARYEEQG